MPVGLEGFIDFWSDRRLCERMMAKCHLQTPHGEILVSSPLVLVHAGRPSARVEIRHWFEASFDTTADADGLVQIAREGVLPVSLRIVEYRVQTLTECKDRPHLAVLRIVPESGASFEIRASIEDCKLHHADVDKRVSAGPVVLNLEVDGFRSEEPISGVAAVRLSWF